MFKALFLLHVLAAAVLVGWAVFESILRGKLARARAPQARAGLMGLSIAWLPVVHTCFALGLVTGIGMLAQSHELELPPSWVALKELVAALLSLVLVVSARSVRAARAALLSAGESDAVTPVLDAAFARTGTWMRLLGLGFVLNFALGLLRPGA